MKVWIHRIAGILQLGGGFSGAVVSLNTLLDNHLAGLPFILTVIIFALYFFTLIAGLLLLEDNPKGPDWSILAQALQIPFLSFPLFAYKFIVGFSIYIDWIGNMGGIDYHLGSQAILDIHDNNSWGIGINALALVLCLLIGV